MTAATQNAQDARPHNPARAVLPRVPPLDRIRGAIHGEVTLIATAVTAFLQVQSHEAAPSFGRLQSLTCIDTSSPAYYHFRTTTR